MAVKNKKRGKRKPKAKPTAARPSNVSWLEVEGGRRKQGGDDATLFARIEERDGHVSASLGSAYDKLQIRVTLSALRQVVKKMEARS